MDTKQKEVTVKVYQGQIKSLEASKVMIQTNCVAQINGIQKMIDDINSNIANLEK